MAIELKKDNRMEEQDMAPSASRWKRLSGSLIDSLIVFVVFIPITFAIGVHEQMFAGESMTSSQQIILIMIELSIFFGLNGYLLQKDGKTIGKIVVGTRIVDMHGNVPRFGHLFVNRYLIINLAGLIPVLGVLASLVNALFIFGDERRCLHDYLAGTRVIDA